MIQDIIDGALMGLVAAAIVLFIRNRKAKDGQRKISEQLKNEKELREEKDDEYII